jgi:hypothetical protein
MHFIAENAPNCFRRTNPSGIKILLDFIQVLPVTNSECCTIRAFKNILVDILDCSNSCTALAIEVTFKLQKELRNIRDNMAVVKLNTIFDDESTIIRTAVARIAISINRGLLLKRFGEAFGAFAIYHAGSIRLV